MKQFVKSAILMLASLLILTGCQTYFGYNSQKQVTTKADFHKENVEAKQTWERYLKCYSKPIPEDVHNKLLKDAKELAEKHYGRYRDYNTEKRYQSWKNELFEKASHRYRIRRGRKEGVFPVEFFRIYSTPQRFQKAQEEQKSREQQFAVVADELKKIDIPEAVQISSTVKNYFYKDGSLYGNYIVKMQEPKLAIEIRTHLYSKNAEWVPPFVFLRYPFDFIGCFCGDWELAEHKPDFFTLLSYCPPFSWFFTRTPPYLTSPSAQKTKHQVIISKEGTVVVEREKKQKISGSEIPQAIKWLQLRAKEGDAVAQFNLAMLYDDGKYIEKDSNLAHELFGSAVKVENVHVEKCIISSLPASKIEVIANKINDSPRKMRILKEVADRGSSTAQYSYAILCERNKDSKQALKYYKMAADQGNIDAAIAVCRSTNYSYSIKEYVDVVKRALQTAARTDDIILAEKIIKSGTDNLEVGNALQIALTNDSCKVAELLLLTYVPYNFNYASALKITATNKDSKCLPMILSRKKFSLEELAYALDEAIKCNSTKNVRLILKYMDTLLKPEMSIGMNCAVPISKNNQEILSELAKRNIKISISSLADLIKFNSPKTIENVKFVIRDKKIWDLASPDMDSAMLASAETGNIGVLKLLIANGGEINCANDKDETPLIIARNKGHIEYVRYIASLGGTDSILAIKRYREKIKDKREKLKVQKRKDFFQQHRVRHAAEIKKLRQKFFNQKLAHADKATMDMLIDKSCKIIWYNDDYPQCMEAINLRLSSTPEKNKFYGTVDTVLAVEDLYPNYKNLYKKLNSFTSRRGAVADSDIQKKAGMIILTNALCSAWAEDDEINYMQTELNKMKEELDSIGPGLSAGMGIASLGIQRLTPIFIKILENAQTSKKTFKIMVKIEKGTDGLEYITVKSLDPHVMITDSNLY